MTKQPTPPELPRWPYTPGCICKNCGKWRDYWKAVDRAVIRAARGKEKEE